MTKTTYEVSEDLLSYFEKFGKLSGDLINHGLNEGAKKMHSSANRNLKRARQTDWSHKLSKKGSHKQLISSKRISKKKAFGDRTNIKGEAMKPKNMSSMIKSYLNEGSHLVVLMGRHPTFTPVKYERGIRKGKSGKSIGGTSRGGESNPNDIVNILQKMDEGGEYSLTKKQSWLLSNTIVIDRNAKGELVETKPFLRKKKGGSVEPLIKKVKYRRTNFASNAYAQTQSAALMITKKEYEQNFDYVMKTIEGK